MPFGCFGPPSGQLHLQHDLDQAKSELSSKQQEIAELKRRNAEASAQQAQRAAGAEALERGASLLRQQVDELTKALQAKEKEATESSEKLKAVLVEAADAKRQVEEERVASRSTDQGQIAAAAAQARIAEYEKQLQDRQVRLEALVQDVAVARNDAAAAVSEAAVAREEANSAREQLAQVLADQSKAIADAEERAAAVAQEAAASTVASAAEMAEKSAAANRQQLEVLRADLAALQPKLEAAEQAAGEVPILRRQGQETQRHLAAALAELASTKELRSDLSERLAECQKELEDANLIRQSLETERQMVAEQLEQVTADRTRLETQVQELEANLLDAVTATAMTSAAAEAATAGGGDGRAVRAADDEGQDEDAVAEAVSRSAGGDGAAGGEDDPARLEALGAKALAVQLVTAREEARDLRKELERTIVGHAEEEEKVQTENEELKTQLEELRAAVAAAESKIIELEIAQAVKDQLSAQLGNTQYALEEARNNVESLRQEIVGLELERADARSREEEAQAEVQKLQQQVKGAQMRAVELVSANADLQVEQAKLRSEVLSHGVLSDSNTQMATQLLTDYHSLKTEHARVRGELQRKDEMLALLQEQLSSLTEIDLDSMLRQIDNVQMRKGPKKTMVAAPVEAMLAAAGLTGRSGASSGAASAVPSAHPSSGGGAVGTPTAAQSAAAGANGTGPFGPMRDDGSVDI